MANKFMKWVEQGLLTDIAPMVYILMGVSIFIGAAFAAGEIVNSEESVLYGSGVLVDRELWGGLLFLFSSSAMTGLLVNAKQLVVFGSLGCFLLWTFAAVSLVQQGHIYILLSVALLHMGFHSYIYLSSSLNILRRTASTPIVKRSNLPL